jgi:hypothetical protein
MKKKIAGKEVVKSELYRPKPRDAWEGRILALVKANFRPEWTRM